METKAKRLLLTLIVCFTAVGGFFLRTRVLKYVLGENRLLAEGSVRYYLYGLFILAAAALLAYLAFSLCFRKLPALKDNFSANPVWKILTGAVGVFIAVESLMNFRAVSGDKLTSITCICGIVGGLVLLALTAVQLLDKRGSFLFLLPLCIWAALQLVCDYKLWSKDPILADYCFRMLSDVTGMLAIFHIGGFFFDYGKRRITIFWCAACVLFSAISLPDVFGATEALLHRLSLLILSASFLLQLVFCSKLEKKDA